MISISAKLWDSRDIKNRIKNYFSGRNRDRLYPDKDWCEISKIVVEYANSVNLPTSISVLLKKTILLIGQKIYDWTFYVNKILRLDLISTQKIYFSFGAVDEIKIFDLYWKDLMAPDNFIYESNYFRHCPLFSVACIYGCEKFVKERKNEMLDELIEFYPQIKAGDEIYNIMSVSICMTAKKSILENVGSPQRMFEVCLEEGFSKAARYYWEKLDEVDNVPDLTHFAKKCFMSYSASFLNEKKCENLLFLINQMGEEERSLFFTDYADEIITLFLPIWPYHELILELFKFDWNNMSYSMVNLQSFLVSHSKHMNGLEFPLDNELVFQIMQKVWENSPVDKKLYCRRECHFMISSLFLTFNQEIVNLVLNDPCIKEVDSEKISSLIREGFLELVKRGKFDFLNASIETLFNFVPEPKIFLKGYFSNYKFVRDLIVNDESFGFLDQFLDWASESEAERANLKQKINTLSVCRSLTEPLDSITRSVNFEVANKFLKWRLESDSEVKCFKKAMKTYNFVIVEYGNYVRIKAGDLSWLRPGDSLVTLPDEDLYDNADGLTFLKFEEVTELNRGVVLGIKSFCFGENDDFLGPDGCDAKRLRVDYVGTKVGDFIVFKVLEAFIRSRVKGFILQNVFNFSDAFIKFYYETDEEVLKFKKTRLHFLLTEIGIEFLLDFLFNDGFPKTFFDEFCEFCMIPSEKIEEIKIQQRSDIEKFLDTYLIDQRNFELADYYLKWLFGEIKQAHVCEYFINKGALLSYLKELDQISHLSQMGSR